ncbi:MAG: hypothetical protein QM831_28155 [Kofleriaceae bacterium]
MSLEDLLAGRSAALFHDVVSPRAFDSYTRYREIDRGSYDVSYEDVPDLVARARDLARPHVFESARIVRLRPGDYILARADEPRRGTEVVFDLSPGTRPDGDLQYRQHGQVVFRVPCEPGCAAVVPRTQSISCNHQYLSKLHTGDIVRWIGWFVAR